MPKTTKSSLADLTPEQAETLKAYAAWAGKAWRKDLLSDWLRAGSRFPGEYAYLQQIRNQHGPRWLADLPPDTL